MQKRKLFGVMAIACMLCYTACRDGDDNNGNNNTNSPSGVDESFMRSAAYANRAETDAGTLAASKGMDSSVRMFGQMMVNDHTPALNELQSIAGDANVSLPMSPDSMHQAMMMQLQNMQGHSFDSIYMSMQVMDHQATIALFESELNSGRWQRTKDYVNKYLPAIRMHYQMADSINKHL